MPPESPIAPAPASNTAPATADQPVSRMNSTPPPRESMRETMARAPERRPPEGEKHTTPEAPPAPGKKKTLEPAPVPPKGETLPSVPTQESKGLTPAERRAKLEALAKPAPPEHKAPDDVIEPDLLARETDSKEVARRVNGLVGKIKLVAAEKDTVAAELKAAREEVEQLRQATAEVSPEQKEETEALKKELTQFRRRYDLEKDPEFNARYTAKIKEADEVIGAVLKRLPASAEWVLKAIADEKGLVNLARSPRTFTLQKGEGETEIVDGNGLYGRILAILPKVDAGRLELAVSRKDELEAERARTIEAETKKADEYFAQVEKTQGESQRVHAERRKVIKAGLTKFRDAAWQKPDFKDVEVGDSADPSLQEAAKAQNEVRSEMRQLLGDYISDDILTEVMNEALLKIEADPKLEGRAKERAAKEVLEGWGKLVVHAVERHGLAFEVKQRDARIEGLEKEITDLKEGSRTTPRAGSAEHLLEEKTAAPAWQPGQRTKSLGELVQERRSMQGG